MYRCHNVIVGDRVVGLLTFQSTLDGHRLDQVKVGIALSRALQTFRDALPPLPPARPFPTDDPTDSRIPPSILSPARDA